MNLHEQLSMVFLIYDYFNWPLIDTVIQKRGS